MKTKTISFKAIALFLLTAGMGCKEEPYNNVPYDECNCSELKKANTEFTKKNAVLYIVSSEKEEDNLLIDTNTESYFTRIIYNKKTGVARIYSQTGIFLQIYRICNFPEFVKKWTISEKGQKVYFEGDVYNSCEKLGGIATVTYYDYILTILTKS